MGYRRDGLPDNQPLSQRMSYITSGAVLKDKEAAEIILQIEGYSFLPCALQLA